MTKFVCATCGTQYPESEDFPTSCAICEDERQYIGWNGQQWTSLEELKSKQYKNTMRSEGEDGELHSIITEPEFAIGQRAFLLTTAAGNILWDCLTYIDQETIRNIDELGGLKIIAISHPHYYSSMVEWSKAFGGIPVYLHELDRMHVMRPHPSIKFWSGEACSPVSGVTLVNLGGHFEGGTVLHYGAGSHGGGIVLAGDIISVVQDRRQSSFMYSYPNLIPLPKSKIRRIADRIGKYRYEKLYSAFEGKEILKDASNAVQRSVERYIARMED